MSVLGRGLFLLAAILSLSLLAGTTQARPQVSVQTQLGATGIGGDGGLWKSTRLDLGLRAEAIYLRESPNDFGIGPYLETRTAAFVHADYGGGLVALLPVNGTWPVWLGGGGFARRQDHTFAPGGNVFLGWGGRSYNYHSNYAMAYGLLFDVRAHFGDERGVDLVLAATVDLEGLLLPLAYVTSSILH